MKEIIGSIAKANIFAIIIIIASYIVESLLN